MRRAFLLSILTLFLTSCAQENLNKEFRTVVLNFQKSFRLKNGNDSIVPYYSIKFRKSDGDTLFTISRAHVYSQVELNNKRVFQDRDLEPTVIYDFDKLGEKLVYDYPKQKEDNLIKSVPATLIPPFYMYKIKDGKIEFMKMEGID